MYKQINGSRCDLYIVHSLQSSRGEFDNYKEAAATISFHTGSSPHVSAVFCQLRHSSPCHTYSSCSPRPSNHVTTTHTKKAVQPSPAPAFYPIEAALADINTQISPGAWHTDPVLISNVSFGTQTGGY